MSAVLLDTPVIQNDDLISMLDRRDALRNDDCCRIRNFRLESLTNQRIGSSINRTS